ncbi:undecaprenyldiphospho-muramoylpentapeptide beta-N-acetylglucosaminyltransferase [Acanthopleuribacter pedis]|uniref:UDP-N-acetylglucosamine--N-acetylmuramyl-(pentapeptide) pyrophosphoryl-undecaprenol N-acetylglucosamine transferase n=1 Tax=Acanthopleuribacter pedis TaxID=442870 RepID=A0A8J7QF96_9BACT|nr:undecaprenyldiphospho-muramoylpentapeptide beta-N-acetylglucosaminyltransferase [Acanthopleuribacter pedis]MBO1318755.1 undecaprenyldiphospho-muramoylpentapeptide beta-N-acetylglucosaminyltransferase [Acanthopleuribacter pedis]
MTTTYMIAGGGTGGHIFPALAIGQALRDQVPEARIVFVGTRYGMETSLIPDAGEKLLTLPIRGLLGKSMLKKAAMIWRIPASFLLSVIYLLRFRPKVVIGVGGYASAPLLWTAAMLRIPTLIQEQNAFPGLANRMCAKVAQLACLGFEEAGRHLACAGIVTGNPVRRDFCEGKPWSRKRPLLLVLGGSQGARSLNERLPVVLQRVIEPEMQLEVVHQCGRKYVAEVEQAYRDAPFPVRVVSFIEDLSKLMDDVRLVVCRSGASTIAELKLVRVPAVLIPFPAATHDHQTFNAKSLAALGAAELVPENDLDRLESLLQALLGEPERLQKMVTAYPRTRVNSADQVARLALQLQERRPVKDILKEQQAHVS